VIERDMTFSGVNPRMSPYVASTATMPRTIAALAQEMPEALMLIDAATDRRVTVKQFDEGNKAWARRLAALGVKPGDNVATMMGPTFDAYNAWLGLSALGAVEVPINPQLRGRSLAYLLNHSQPQVLIVHAAYLEQVVKLEETLEHLRTVVTPDLEAAPALSTELPFRVISGAEFHSAEVEIDYRLARRHDTACIIYTSGTTGPPKGVVIPWGWIRQANDHMPARITGGTRYSYLSPAHMSGKGALAKAVAERRTLVLRETFSVREFWRDIAKYDCRVSNLFPQMIKYLLAAPPSEDDRETPLQHIWIAPLIPELQEFMERFDIAVSTGFGSTEVGGPIARLEVDVNNLKSCGTVNPDVRGYEVRLVDEFDEELPPGKVGELIVRTSVPWTLNVGYYRNSEATAEAWRNGWFHTGDAMTKDDEGNFYFVDRYKDCIRRKGENISSFEVEDYALSYPGVADAAAVGVSSPDGEQEVKIFLMEKTSNGIDLEAMSEWLSDHMPKFMVPRYLEVLPDFPRTPATGRIQKRLLRDQAAGPREWDRTKPSSNNATPRSATRMAPSK
jgi:carnitine-CoA ligase